MLEGLGASIGLYETRDEDAIGIVDDGVYVSLGVVTLGAEDSSTVEDHRRRRMNNMAVKRGRWRGR